MNAGGSTVAANVPVSLYRGGSQEYLFHILKKYFTRTRQVLPHCFSGLSHEENLLKSTTNLLMPISQRILFPRKKLINVRK